MGVFTATFSVPSAIEDLVEPAFIDGFDFHGGLVGFDFGDDVAGADIVALRV